MLLNSVIIVLREVLEAGLLISLLLALSKTMHLSFRWMIIAIVGGFFGAVLYASNLSTISELFEYTGQEITNASLQIVIYCFLALLVITVRKPDSSNTFRISLLMSVPIVLAITREGSEIFIYFSGFMHNPDQLLPVLLGGCLGAGIGASIGVLVYFGLLYCSTTLLFIISRSALLIIATGILSQSIPLLIQADIIEASAPLWNSSDLISEESITGQLLYAVLGYESKPAPQQAAAYLAGIIIILSGLLINKFKQKHVL